jgi:uncharacterized protein
MERKVFPRIPPALPVVEPLNLKNIKMKYEYWKAQNGNWYWHLKAANGEKVAQGEGYTTKQNCLAAIRFVKSSATAPEVNLTPSAA